jgi:hypothetical protein
VKFVIKELQLKILWVGADLQLNCNLSAQLRHRHSLRFEYPLAQARARVILHKAFALRHCSGPGLRRIFNHYR